MAFLMDRDLSMFCNSTLRHEAYSPLFFWPRVSTSGHRVSAGGEASVQVYNAAGDRSGGRLGAYWERKGPRRVGSGSGTGEERSKSRGMRGFGALRVGQRRLREVYLVKREAGAASHRSGTTFLHRGR